MWGTCRDVFRENSPANFPQSPVAANCGWSARVCPKYTPPQARHQSTSFHAATATFSPQHPPDCQTARMPPTRRRFHTNSKKNKKVPRCPTRVVFPSANQQHSSPRLHMTSSPVSPSPAAVAAVISNRLHSQLVSSTKSRGTDGDREISPRRVVAAHCGRSNS